MHKSENCAKIIHRQRFSIGACLAASKHVQFYYVTLLQKVYLQHGGGNCC